MDINTLLDVSFRGNIYIVQNNKVLYERESGFADQPNEIPNTRETKFASASAGKVFVAVAILQLVEQGRIRLADTDDYRTNIFSVDVKGTGAGGAFITVKDMVRFWTHLLDGSLLAKESVSEMLSKQSGDGSDAEEGYYGYGVWIIDNPDGRDYAYFQGCDPGVSFILEYNPNNGMISVLVSSYGDNVWREMRKIREVLY